MSLTQPSVMSVEDFKNCIYGTTMIMLAPQLDSALHFVKCEDIKDEDKHVLPLVSDNANLTQDEMLQQCMSYYGSSGKEEAIDRYVREHVLDTQEHLNTFSKNLAAHLLDRRQMSRRPGADSVSRREQPAAPAPTQAAPQSALAPVVRPPPIAPGSARIRGQHRLQRRMEHLNEAIDQEQATYQLQQQLPHSQPQAQPQPQPHSQPQPQPQPPIEPAQSVHSVKRTLRRARPTQPSRLAQAYAPVQSQDAGAEAFYAEDIAHSDDSEQQAGGVPSEILATCVLEDVPTDEGDYERDTYEH